MYKRILFFIVILLQLPSHSSAETEVNIIQNSTQKAVGTFHDTVTVALLDKITAKKTEHPLKVGEIYTFGTMRIQVINAWKSSEDDLPEAKVFFVIDDYGLDGTKVRVFSGWMFQSNTSVNALEHPTYDLWILSVEGDSPSSTPSKLFSKDSSGEPVSKITTDDRDTPSDSVEALIDKLMTEDQTSD